MSGKARPPLEADSVGAIIVDEGGIIGCDMAYEPGWLYAFM